MSMAGAIVTRWDATGLDTSICELFRVYPGGEVGGTPEDDDTADPLLPRAQFYLEGDNNTEGTVGYTLREIVLRFELWHSSGVSLETALDLIEDTFDNSYRAGTDPVTIPNGVINKIEYVSRESGPANEQVHFGFVEFEIEWQKTFAVPD